MSLILYNIALSIALMKLQVWTRLSYKTFSTPKTLKVIEYVTLSFQTGYKEPRGVRKGGGVQNPFKRVRYYLYSLLNPSPSQHWRFFRPPLLLQFISVSIFYIVTSTKVLYRLNYTHTHISINNSEHSLSS